MNDTSRPHYEFAPREPNRVRDMTEQWTRYTPLADLPPVALAYIDSFCESKRITVAALEQLAARARINRHAPVFPSKQGTYLDPSNIAARVLKPAARRASVPWASFHTLRHTCATMLFRHGLNAKQVQMWLGHHSPAFTLATYVHLLPDDLPEAGFLDGITGGNIGATEPAGDARDSEEANEPQTRIVPAEPKAAETLTASS
jgi:Phage integrase family